MRPFSIFDEWNALPNDSKKCIHNIVIILYQSGNCHNSTITANISNIHKTIAICNHTTRYVKFSEINHLNVHQKQ